MPSAFEVTVQKVEALQLYFQNKRLTQLHDEKRLQAELQEHLQYYANTRDVELFREYRLDKKNIPDFFIDGIAVEVKIKGSKIKIYDQLVRYAQFSEVKGLLLVTLVSMGLPTEVETKPSRIIRLSLAWH